MEHKNKYKEAWNSILKKYDNKQHQKAKEFENTPYFKKHIGKIVQLETQLKNLHNAMQKSVNALGFQYYAYSGGSHVYVIKDTIPEDLKEVFIQANCLLELGERKKSRQMIKDLLKAEGINL